MSAKSSEVVGWMFMDLATANMIAWTEDREFLDEWMVEIKAGDWGKEIGVMSVDAEGMPVDRLWPEES